MYHVLLYYKIVSIQHPDSEVKLHREVTTALGLTGRILISKDGVNGTVGGSKASIDLYRAYMNQHRIFKKIDFKESTSEVLPFPKMQIRAREEIITTGSLQKIDWSKRGNHVNRETFHQWLQNGEEMILLDMRNDYEWEIGRFKTSIKPPMKYFRDLESSMEFYEQFKGKKIVMFCTGGIRCEPASALFLHYGFDQKNVYQLEGGIVKYAEKYGDAGFYEGKCFVFDDRLALSFGTDEVMGITSSCLHCAQKTDSYRNCANKHCNKLFIACDACNDTLNNTCSSDCQAMALDPANVRPATLHSVKVLHRNK